VTIGGVVHGAVRDSMLMLIFIFCAVAIARHLVRRR
jgi:hypothetical protein